MAKKIDPGRNIKKPISDGGGGPGNLDGPVTLITLFLLSSRSVTTQFELTCSSIHLCALQFWVLSVSSFKFGLLFRTSSNSRATAARGYYSRRHLML